MKGKPRWWQLGLIIVGVVVFLGLAVLTTAYLALRSPDVQQRILASVKEPLSEAGVTMDVETLSLDLLAGLNLQNLKLKINRPPLIQAELQLARLRLGYSFWGLLKKQLNISEVLIEGLTGDVRLDLADTPPPPEEPSQGLEPLLEMLRNPPLTLDSPSLIVRNNQLKVHLTQGSRHVKVDLRQADIEAALHLQAGELDLSSQIAFELDVQLDQSDPKSGDLSVQTKLSIAPHFKLSVRVPKNELNWRLQLQQLDLKLENTKVHQAVAGQSSLDLALARLELRPQFDLQRQGTLSAQPPVMEALWPLDFKGSQKLIVQGVAFDQYAKAQKTSLTSNLTVQNDWQIRIASLTPGRDQSWQVSQTLEVNDLIAQKNGQTLAATKALELSLQSTAEQGEGKASLTVNLSPMTTEALQEKLAFRQEMNLGFNLNTLAFRLIGDAVANGEKILQVSGEGNDQNGMLKARLQMQVTPQPSLVGLHAGFSQLEKLGWPQIDLLLNHHTLHPVALDKLSKDNWQELTITNSLQLKVSQLRNSAKNLVNFKNLIVTQELSLPARPAGEAASRLNVDTTIKVESLTHPSLKKAIDLAQDLNLKAQLNDRINGSVDGKTILDGFQLAQLNFAWEDKPSELYVDNQIDLHLEPSLQKIVEAAKALDDLGGIKLESQHKIKLRHGAARLQDIQGLDLAQIKVDAQLTQILSQTPVGQAKRVLSLGQPLRIDSRIQLDKGRAELLTRLTESKITAKDKIQILNLQTLIKASVRDVKKMADGEVKVMADADGIELLKDMPNQAKIHQLLRKFKFVFHGVLSNKEALTIKTLFVGLHDNFLQFKGQGAFRLSGQGHFDGQLDSVLTGIKDAPFEGTGRMTVPLKVVLFDKTRLSVDATPKFQNFYVNYGDIQLRNVNGGIQVHEELSIDPQGRIGFLYLDTQNAFARVDYDSLEPYVGERSLLSVDQLRFKHIQIGPLVENFEIRQNLILLNELKVDLLQGSALGRIYLDLHPERLQMGFLGRFSGIQAELIKEPNRRIPVPDWAPLSGRMALNFDIRKRLATGRLDLTEIGQRQLLSLLDVLDPEYKDPQMITARRALRVAYPQGLAVGMEQGLMDLNISLGGVISKDLVIRSVPLTGLINAKAGETLQQIEKLLQSGG